MIYLRINGKPVEPFFSVPVSDHSWLFIFRFRLGDTDCKEENLLFRFQFPLTHAWVTLVQVDRGLFPCRTCKRQSGRGEWKFYPDDAPRT